MAAKKKAKKTKAKAKKTTRKTAAKKTKTKAKAKKTAAKATRKTATKKAATAKTATRAAAKPAAPTELQVKTTGYEKIKKTRTKSQIVKELSESTGLPKKNVNNLFENLSALMSHDLTKGPGTFQVPGLLKVLVVKKKAVPARKGVNPFTGEEMMFKAKPARNVVRARPLKGLKDMVEKKR